MCRRFVGKKYLQGCGEVRNGQQGKLTHNVAATEVLANSRGALNLGCQPYGSQSLNVSSTSGGHVPFVEAGSCSAATGSSQLDR